MEPDTIPPSPQPNPEPTWPDRSWQLRRSVTDRKLKGVAGGIAGAAGIDVTLIRILFAVAMLGGWGIVAYIVLACVMKDETAQQPVRRLPQQHLLPMRIGLGVAAFFALGAVTDNWLSRDGGAGLAIVLIALGALVLYARRDQQSGPLHDPGAWPHPDADDVDRSVAPPWSPPVSEPLGAGIDWRSTVQDLLRVVGAFVAVWALLALLAGTALVGSGAVSMRLPGLPLAAGLLGLGGLVVSVVRRGRLAAMAASVVTLFVATVLAVGLVALPGSHGSQRVVVVAGEQIPERIEHGVGPLRVDLAAALWPADEERTIDVQLGAGSLEIVVPRDVATDLRLELGAGSATLFGASQQGPGIRTTAATGTPTDGRRLHLRVSVGVGEVVAVEAAARTERVSCDVEVGESLEEAPTVTCPHPPRLAGKPMQCSVMVVGRDDVPKGNAFCTDDAVSPPAPGALAVPCSFPADPTARGGCRRLTEVQRSQVARAAGGPGPASTAAPVSSGPLVGAPTCGTPMADGDVPCSRPVVRGGVTSTELVVCRQEDAAKPPLCPPPAP